MPKREQRPGVPRGQVPVRFLARDAVMGMSAVDAAVQKAFRPELSDNGDSRSGASYLRHVVDPGFPQPHIIQGSNGQIELTSEVKVQSGVGRSKKDGQKGWGAE